MGTLFLIRSLVGFLKTAVVLAPLGEEVQLRLSGDRSIAEAFSANDRVARPVEPQNGMNTLLSFSVKGVAPGINPVVLTDRRGRSQLFLVVVPKPTK